jgi:hypothetical protein
MSFFLGIYLVKDKKKITIILKLNPEILSIWDIPASLNALDRSSFELILVPNRMPFKIEAYGSFICLFTVS